MGAKIDIRTNTNRNAAFQGANFDKQGFCLHHPTCQLTNPIKIDGKIMYEEMKRTCPGCQAEKHKSKRGTSLGGGKVKEGRVHGQPRPSVSKQVSSSRSKKSTDKKPRREYDTPFDEKGRCHYHKNVQLAAKKLGGGWKVLHAACPKCMEEKHDDDRSVKSSSSKKSTLTNKLGDAQGKFDKNGCCVLHTHIQVAKRRVFGGGWKVRLQTV